jgi:hypothetical protein
MHAATMEIQTFEDDLTEVKEFGGRLRKFLLVERNFVSGSLVVGLSAPFGAGKSTFLRMWRRELESESEGAERFTVVPLNAWESDYLGDPLFSIVASLLEVLPKDDGSGDKVRSAVRDIGWFAVSIGSQVVAKATGISFTAAGEFAEKKRGKDEPTGPVPMDAFSSFELRRKAMTELKAAIGELIVAKGGRMLFLVDELDRCRPDFAISYLETIKHMFDLEGAVFVIAADRKQLANSARRAFGEDLDFDEYYRKFVHREVPLPALSEAAYWGLTQTYFRRFMQEGTGRKCRFTVDQVAVVRVAELCGQMTMTPRQMQECFRVLAHLTSSEQERQAVIPWAWAAGALAMVSLRIGRRSVYLRIGSGLLTEEDAKTLIVEDLALKNGEWWLRLLDSGKAIRYAHGRNFVNMLLDINPRGSTKSEETDFQSGWGGQGFGFPGLYQLIEGVYTV